MLISNNRPAWSLKINQLEFPTQGKVEWDSPADRSNILWLRVKVNILVNLLRKQIYYVGYIFYWETLRLATVYCPWRRKYFMFQSEKTEGPGPLTPGMCTPTNSPHHKQVAGWLNAGKMAEQLSECCGVQSGQLPRLKKSRNQLVGPDLLRERETRQRLGLYWFLYFFIMK